MIFYNLENKNDFSNILLLQKYTLLYFWSYVRKTFYVNDDFRQKSSDIYPTFSSYILYTCKYIIFL